MLQIGEIKLMIQNSGIRFDDEILNEVKAEYKTPNSKMNSIMLKISLNGGERIPVYASIYNNKADAYLVTKRDGKYFISVLSETNINVCFMDKKDVYGIPYGDKSAGDIIRIKANEYLDITLDHNCIHFLNNMECKFCNINSWPSKDNGNLNQIIDIAYLYQNYNEFSHISITGGTGKNSDKGLKRIAKFVGNLRKKGVTVPIGVEFEAIEDENYSFLEELKELGVTTVSCNLEFMSDDLRLELMPGKGQIPFEIYIKNWERCVRIFGKNQVYTNILLFEKDSQETFMSRAKEIMDVGVIPSMGIMLNGPGVISAPPKLEKQLNYFKETASYLHKKNLNPLLAIAGCHKSGVYSPIKEFFKTTTDLIEEVSPTLA